jgi:hypothetical protein
LAGNASSLATAVGQVLYGAGFQAQARGIATGTAALTTAPAPFHPAGQAGAPVTCSGSLTTSTGVLFDGTLRIIGNQFANGGGTPVQLRGANMQGLDASCAQGQQPWYGLTPNMAYYSTWFPTVVECGQLLGAVVFADKCGR